MRFVVSSSCMFLSKCTPSLVMSSTRSLLLMLHCALGVGDVTVVAGGVDITGVVCGMSGGVGPALRARPHVVRRSSKTSLAIH